MKHFTIYGLITLVAAFSLAAAPYESTDAMSTSLNSSGAGGNITLPQSGQAQSAFSVFGFEPLAVKRVSLLSPNDKELTVDATIEAVKTAIDSEPGMETAIGTNDLDRLTYHEDDDADGAADETGRMLEVRFTDIGISDELLLRASGTYHVVAMPLGIVGVLTHDDGGETEIQAYAAQPETYVRVFWRDLDNRKSLEALAAIQGNRLDTLVRETLGSHGFTDCDEGHDCANTSKGPLLPDSVIKVMEAMARFLAGDRFYSLADYDHVGPSVTIPDSSVKDVVSEIEKEIGDGTQGNIGPVPLEVAFMNASGRNFEALNSILARAPDEIWGQHKALVDWVVLRTLTFDPEEEVALVEAYQPFYATTALGAPTFNHFLALPCGYGVWQEGEDVRMSVLNPMAVFSTLFNDGMVEVCLSTDLDDLTLCRLFMKFPMIVFNDVASVMNGVLEQLLGVGVGERIPLYEISEFREC